ncbi:MAG: hypothetical protein KF883_06855 [Thermomicrobiales bacterium]|nr:hypothetical protein [Thermomicrobiales bacterium]
MDRLPHISIVAGPVATADSPAIDTALALASGRASAALVARLLDTDESRVQLERLDAAGIDLEHVERASLAEFDVPMALPIDAMFSADCCLVDLADADRFRFLVDLPVHTWPAARLAGRLERLSTFPEQTGREILERIDSIAGRVEDAFWLTGSADPGSIISTLHHLMQNGNLRLGLISDGRSVHAISRSEVMSVAVDRPPLPAALLSSVVYATACRLDPAAAIEFVMS